MPQRKLPPNEEIIKMYESGMSSGEIAEICQCSPISVISLFRRLNFPRRTIQEAVQIRNRKGRINTVKFWLGKKQPPEMVEKRISKIRGENHWLWKGGNSLRPYRGLKKKEKCEECNGKINLGIHHKDLDYNNNHPNNLQVLCVSCHITLHKRVYWQNIRDGKEHKLNSPIGWKRK